MYGKLYLSGETICSASGSVNLNPVLKQNEEDGIPALSSAKRAPTRSECFKNLSAQCDRHCSYSGNELQSKTSGGGVVSYFF